ncbi:hypothetical protein M514_03546 [Trichuris suis]|uniref:Uncharacterized protein n=1 Tax=Trichuris suis TaxID=68888 RepID=A0A085ME48_9BILA|nr:hypothetical protein M513_03546 [Trichuris suis]KFD71295.1 hypothetical protein M514_03546 [Trichuris suis]KHJ48329.1 hypothetical protein D918_01600 [Trichuris suis]
MGEEPNAVSPLDLGHLVAETRNLSTGLQKIESLLDTLTSQSTNYLENMRNLLKSEDRALGNYDISSMELEALLNDSSKSSNRLKLMRSENLRLKEQIHNRQIAIDYLMAIYRRNISISQQQFGQQALDPIEKPSQLSKCCSVLGSTVLNSLNVCLEVGEKQSLTEEQNLRRMHTRNIQLRHALGLTENEERNKET